MKWYVGIRTVRDNYQREIFQSQDTPIMDGTYFYCIGPFRTKRGAIAMRDYGLNNPHMQTVDEAEKLAKKWVKENARSNG